MVASTHSGRQTADLDGILIANKEAGWTSHDVVAKVRGLLGGAKVGHAGTLDPAATGVLPVLIGRATRVAEYVVDWDKEYRAVLRLGESTDTEDATGRVIARSDAVAVTETAVREVVAGFRGPQRQVPPMYSAVKVGGRPLYKAARAGKTIERPERTIVVHALDVLAVDGRDVTLRVVCSKGTYVRTLCADIGRALGVGGHLLALERLRVGPWSIAQAATMRQIIADAEGGTIRERLLTIGQALARLPSIVVTDEQVRIVLHGGAIVQTGPWPSSVGHSIAIRLEDKGGRLLGIGVPDARAPGLIKAHKVLVEIEAVN